MLWTGILILVLAFLMGNAPSLALKFAKSPRGAVIGGVYIVVHLLAYGFVLEGILTFIYGSPPFVTSTFALVSTNLYYPASIGNVIAGLAFSPSFTLLVPPIYDLSLSLFSIVTAVTIDLLILANVSVVGQIGAVKSSVIRARAYLAMPVTGIALGASCCMSLPVLLSIADPALTALSSLTWVFYVTYFVLPVFAIVVLKFNLDLANRTAAKAVQLAPKATG
jgi:hypothetical protein